MLQILKFVFKRKSIDCIIISNIIVRYFLTHCLIIHAIRRKDDYLNYICERVFTCQWVKLEKYFIAFFFIWLHPKFRHKRLLQIKVKDKRPVHACMGIVVIPFCSKVVGKPRGEGYIQQSPMHCFSRDTAQVDNDTNTMHIGRHIRKVLDMQGMPVAVFARKLHTVRVNAYDIFERRSIDTELLCRISQILNYNFFHDLSEDFIEKQNASLNRKF